MRLKQLLWDSLEEWSSLHDGWMQVRYTQLSSFPLSSSASLTLYVHPQTIFDQLDLEQLSSQVNQYGKYVHQLEKGLPRNSVVPCLKHKVEDMRQKVGRT